MTTIPITEIPHEAIEKYLPTVVGKHVKLNDCIFKVVSANPKKLSISLQLIEVIHPKTYASPQSLPNPPVE